MLVDSIGIKGYVVRTITYKDGKKVVDGFSNTVLSTARVTGAHSLVNKEPLFITEMLFGDGGTDKGQVKPVKLDTEWLYGVTRAKKKVTAQVDPKNPAQAIFTATLDYEDANDLNINEMGLLTNKNQLYCMATFPDLGKTELMKIDWDWHVVFV